MHSLTNFNAGSTIFLAFSYLVKITYQADEINVYYHLYYSLYILTHKYLYNAVHLYVHILRSNLLRISLLTALILYCTYCIFR